MKIAQRNNKITRGESRAFAECDMQEYLQNGDAASG